MDFRFYFRLLVHRLPVMVALILVCGGLATAVAMRMPPTYQTSAQLLVESPQIPEGMVASSVQTDPAEQLQVIQQRLMTRTNLIDIANRHAVFADRGMMEPDTVVAEMRKATSIFRSSGRDQATLMTIRFEARSGQIAANVVNDYVTRVLETNSNFRRRQVEGTTSFFRQEVDRLSEELDRHSAEIAAFRSENANALPEDQSYRLNRQTLLQERMARLERERAMAAEQRDRVVAVFESTGSINPSADGRSGAQRSAEEERLAALRFELNEALAVLSENNPRIVTLKARVEQMEKRVRENEAARAQDAREEADSTGPDSPQGRENAALQIALGEIDARIDAIDQEMAATSTELEQLERSITASSANAISLDALQRQYENVEARYVQATNNLNQALMSARIEASSQGERISVIESANVPRTPTGPNRMAIGGAGFGVGLGLAAGFFFLLELLNRTIRRPSELQSHFGIAPIATIPYMESSLRRWLRRSSLIAATIFVLVSIPAGLWWIDTNYMPLQLLVEQGMAKLGLG